jgi:hypothetical protein
VHASRKSIAGMMLVEVVLALSLMSVLVLLLTQFILPTAQRSLDIEKRWTAVHVAQSLMDEIWSARFDEHAHGEGPQDCSVVKHSSLPSCTPPAQLGVDLDERANEIVLRDSLDDVDDYDGFDQSFRLPYSTQTYAQRYPDIQFKVSVQYSTKTGVVASSMKLYKLIRIDIQVADAKPFSIEAIRGHY